MALQPAGQRFAEFALSVGRQETELFCARGFDLGLIVYYLIVFFDKILKRNLPELGFRIQQEINSNMYKFIASGNAIR